MTWKNVRSTGKKFQTVKHRLQYAKWPADKVDMAGWLELPLVDISWRSTIDIYFPVNLFCAQRSQKV